MTLDAIENHMGTEPHLPEWAELANNQFPAELGKMTIGEQDVQTTLDNMAAAAQEVLARHKARNFA